MTTNLQIVGTSTRIQNRLADLIEHEHAARVQEVFTEEAAQCLALCALPKAGKRGGR